MAENGASAPRICSFDSAEPQKPRSSPDIALTAFCQLGALRIGAKRCMLMFLDTEYTYVLAEATKTLSLLDDDVHNSEDNLWRYVPVYNHYLRQRHHIMSVSDTDDFRANF